MIHKFITEYDSELSIVRKTEDLIQCKDCKYLDVINSNAVYARCEKHGIEFLPFEDDTRECFCSWAERKEEFDCNDCYYSMQNCNDISICCEDETALCDNFEPVGKEEI